MPESFATGGTQDKCVGLMTRYVDEQNYYYLSLRSSNTVSLRKLVNGAIVNLGSAPLTVTPGTWYSLRLEAVGQKLRAFVDGKQVLEANDGSLATGICGVATYRAAARVEQLGVYQP
jgi:pectate lyase